MIVCLYGDLAQARVNLLVWLYGAGTSECAFLVICHRHESMCLFIDLAQARVYVLGTCAGTSIIDVPVVLSSIVYSHTCNAIVRTNISARSTALTNTSTRVSSHVRSHLIPHVTPPVRARTCGLMHYTHAYLCHVCIITTSRGPM